MYICMLYILFCICMYVSLCTCMCICIHKPFYAQCVTYSNTSKACGCFRQIESMGGWTVPAIHLLQTLFRVFSFFFL